MKSEFELNNYQFKENSFNFVQADSKISDKKLDTKPRSATQDAFIRFCKNKSSVVAAVILGILILMAIFVPIFSPYDTENVHLAETFLEPKLFKAGTGFWDGTKKYSKTVSPSGIVTAIVYDIENETPVNFQKNAVMNLKVDESPTLINVAHPYGKGGYVVMENQFSTSQENAVLESWNFNVSVSGNYKAEVEMNDVEGLNGGVLGEYRVVLKNGETEIVLKDWSNDYSSYTLDLSEAIKNASLTTMQNAKFVFELKPAQDKYSYILIKKCDITTDDAEAYISEKNGDKASFDKLGFTDASNMVLKTADSYGVFPAGYWSSTGRKGIYAAEIYYCEFVYDTYEAVYGRTTTTFGATEIKQMVAQGLCEYDEKIGPSSFKRLSDECIIEEISEQKINTLTGALLEVKAVTNKYSELGYKKMPQYIFGTDSSGIDLFTRMFEGMRTSLLLGVCTAAFCLVFGLIWGSISGYFGGIVDLSMERFCDILGGVPWIVIMTLCILHLGNNFLTFFLALCLTGWMGTAARTRTQFYRFKGQEYVLASRTLGARDLRLIFKHILPNSLGTIVTSSVLMIPSTIFSEATLAYLNLGLQGTHAFGVLLSNNQTYIQSNPYLIVIPSVIMAFLMISFNLFGNGLRDALNPSLRGAEG